jgi:hypothetical protein
VGSEEALRAFRERFHGSLRRRADALFELTNAILTAGSVPSPPHLKLQKQLEDHEVQLLVRLHSNRVFYADPEQDDPRPVGRPRRHGARFDLHDPKTWPEPCAEHRCENDDYGEVRVRSWSDLHPKNRRIGERYGCEKAPVVKGKVILVEVSRLPRETRKPKALFLRWAGEGEPDLDLI